jgi:uncharacterized protein YbjT (DUF2867 family)
MRIFLTGGTGFIGGHLLRALSARGHLVTCLARGEGARRLEAMALPGVRVVRGEFTDPGPWSAELMGQQAVMNTVGILREKKPGEFAVVHTEAPIALFEAAARAGVGKIVQLSALGADEGARSQFHQSKRAADARLAELGVPYVVLRPSFVYGPGEYSMTNFLSLAALPITPVPGDGQFRAQPVHVEDVARALVLAVEREDLQELTIDMGSRATLTFDAMLDILARWLGRRGGARKLHIPWGVMHLVAAATDRMGGRGPVTREEVGMLRRGSTADVHAFVEQFGFEPVSFEVGIARRRHSEATLWHARLKPLRVPLRLSVAFIWIASGIVSAFLYPESESRALLERVGITGAPATAALYATSLFEIALGLATAAGWRIRLLGTIQLALILAFTALLTAGMPELWLHPFGPLTKNVPLIGATLVMMGLEE